MGLLTRLVKTTALGGAAGIGTFFFLTRKNTFVPMDNSPLFRCGTAQIFKPARNGIMFDDCQRKVPLDQIKPELLQKEGELVRAFCAGVWSGYGYGFQRWYLTRKYFGDDTRDNLWTKDELKQASYQVGTRITDHFEVVERTPTSIVVRCGDSPRRLVGREGDGVFEIAAEVKQDEGVAEFHFRTLFWSGIPQAKPEPPMGPWMQWLHQQYDKIWMETGLLNVKK